MRLTTTAPRTLTILRLPRPLRPFTTSTSTASSNTTNTSHTTPSTPTGTQPKAAQPKAAQQHQPSPSETPNPDAKSPTLQADEALRAKMSGLQGDGGEAGVEYEDGEAVSMKRSVKNNMFRYI